MVNFLNAESEAEAEGEPRWKTMHEELPPRQPPVPLHRPAPAAGPPVPPAVDAALLELLRERRVLRDAEEAPWWREDEDFSDAGQ